MKTTFPMNRIEGILSLFYVFGNTWELIRKVHNEVLYSGADLMANAIVGAPKMHIAGMYMEYDNSGSPSAPAVDRTRTPAFYEALISPQGYARVPLTAMPGYAPSDPEYAGNIVTVQAQTDGTVENGPGFVDNTTQIYSAALVSMPDPADKSQDIIFSAANLYDSGGSVLAPVPKIANAQIGIKWDIKFT